MKFAEDHYNPPLRRGSPGLFALLSGWWSSLRLTASLAFALPVPTALCKSFASDMMVIKALASSAS